MAEKIMQGIKQISELIGQAVKKRVVCLYRVSTVGQVEKDDIPMQKQYCREFCRGQSGWEIVKEFSEKGVSGFKVSAKDRDAIQEIQKMALKGEFDILLVFMFDRLGRRDDETPFVVEWFVKQGIEVWSAMEGQQRFDTHVDKLLNYIRYWQASGESIKTSLRVKTRLEQLTQEGYYTGGRVPFGYQAVKRGRINKKNHEVRDLAIEPGEAEVMKIIFQKYVYEGYGALRLHRYLMDQGLRTKDGKTITMGIINRVIKNPICIGIIQKGESQSSVLPELKIIDEEVFARAQEIVRERVVPQSEVPLTTRGQSLLVGNVYCGHCGARLSLATAGRNYKKKDGTVVKKTYSCYKCYNKAMAAEKCDGQTTYGVSKLDMENKSDLIDLAWMVYYLTWDWCQQSEDNMAQAVELYVESCEDEGVVSNESICQRALDIFACPSPSEAVSVMTTEEEDRLSLADRPVLAAENDLLETMDFFISIGSYTEEDRTAILDKELVNSSVAERCAETLKTLGYLE